MWNQVHKAGISVVTPVRDRFHHLMQTLPTWIAQDEVCEIVIVDFGSEPPIDIEICKLSPKIKLVRSGYGEPWNKGLAQNIGVELSSFDKICKLDADIFVNNLLFYETNMESSQFFSGYIPEDKTKQGCFGQALFLRRDWHFLGGYHEFMHGWGFDDQDFYNRLEDAGLTHRFFDLDDLEDIFHSDEVRGGARLPDDAGLPIDDRIRSNKMFQNARNMFVAAVAPWSANLKRNRVFRQISDGLWECVLDERSNLELRTQKCAAYLAMHYHFPKYGYELYRSFYNQIVTDRFGSYLAKVDERGESPGWRLRLNSGRESV